MWPLLLSLLTVLPGGVRELQPRTPSDEGEPSSSRDVLHERAMERLAGGEEGRAEVLREMREGSPTRRRAALTAVGERWRPDRVESSGSESRPPEGTLEAALTALTSGDPLLREAATSALIACGEPARETLTALVTGKAAEDLPAVPPSRARDALLEFGRYGIEREFLSLWGPDDGSYLGMFDNLRTWGALAPRVLVGIALDRRVVAGEELAWGPYRWRCPPPRHHDREDLRYRALDALGDCGDTAARERLRAFLRRAPAAELFDEDADPIPASWDDALRHAICALGDSGPIRLIERASSPSGWYRGTVEMKRVASAHVRIAQYSTDALERVREFTQAEWLMRRAMNEREQGGVGVDAGEYYNLACVLAQRDRGSDRRRALSALEKAVDAGYSVTSEWCERDGDLKSLREEPGFLALLERLRGMEKRMRESLEGDD